MTAMLHLTEAQLAAIVQKHGPRLVRKPDIEQVVLRPLVQAKPSKYKNKKVNLDGMVFASIKEKKRYVDLRWQEEGRLITGLRRQVAYKLAVNGVDVCAYIADFVYVDLRGRERVEDVKGYRKGEAYRLFKMKKALMLAVHGVVVEEI